MKSSPNQTKSQANNRSNSWTKTKPTTFTKANPHQSANRENKRNSKREKSRTTRGEVLGVERSSGRQQVSGDLSSSILKEPKRRTRRREGELWETLRKRRRRREKERRQRVPLKTATIKGPRSGVHVDEIELHDLVRRRRRRDGGLRPRLLVLHQRSSRMAAIPSGNLEIWATWRTSGWSDLEYDNGDNRVGTMTRFQPLDVNSTI